MRVLLGLLCASVLSSATYGLEVNVVNVPIIEVSQKILSFSAKGLKVGQSGIILSNKDNYRVIIANARILRIKDGIAYASFRAFDSITQKYLPTPIAQPKEGDIASFGRFYNKAIAIAPNQEFYNKILSTQTKTHFMHIDLFGAFLAKSGINDPKPKHFKTFCNLYSIGLVYIMASNGINVLDCQSFALLEEIPLEIPPLSQTQAPFFSRIANIDTGSLSSKLRSKKSRQYFSYYDGLLSESLRAFKLTHKE